MPRLATSLVRKARRANKLLVPLLQTCRNLPSACRELRWLSEHVYKTLDDESTCRAPRNIAAAQKRLEFLCLERARGVPLQYLLGTEFFGDLQLACKPGVLIPRPETADIVLELAKHLLHHDIKQRAAADQPLRVLDLCTGTGCMSFLLHTQLQAKHASAAAAAHPATTTLGIDISARAVRLARHNRARLGLVHSDAHGARHSPLTFVTADMLCPPPAGANPRDHAPPRAPRVPPLAARLAQRPAWRRWDVVMANPPYISNREMRSAAVERSVRRFEPRAALVPLLGAAAARKLRLGASNDHNEDDDDDDDDDADAFYPRILDVAEQVGARTVLMEVGGSEQAFRIRDLARRRGTWDQVDVWRDGMGANSDPDGAAGRTRGRAVVCWKRERWRSSGDA